MSSEHWPILLVEVVLVFGGVLAFGWWQLRSVERDRQALKRRREADAAQADVAKADVAQASEPAAEDPSPPHR